MRRYLTIVGLLALMLLAASSAGAANGPVGSKLPLLCEHPNPTADFVCGTTSVTAGSAFWAGVTYICSKGEANLCMSQLKLKLSYCDPSQQPSCDFTTSPGSYTNISTKRTVDHDSQGNVTVIEFHNFTDVGGGGISYLHWQLSTSGQLVYQGTRPVMFVP